MDTNWTDLKLNGYIKTHQFILNTTELRQITVECKWGRSECKILKHYTFHRSITSKFRAEWRGREMPCGWVSVVHSPHRRPTARLSPTPSPPGANGRRARWAGRNLNDARLNWPALRTSWRDQADGRRISAGQPWPAAKQFIMDRSPNGLSGSDALYSGSRLSALGALGKRRTREGGGSEGMCGALGDALSTFRREIATREGKQSFPTGPFSSTISFSIFSFRSFPVIIKLTHLFITFLFIILLFAALGGGLFTFNRKWLWNKEIQSFFHSSNFFYKKKINRN